MGPLNPLPYQEVKRRLEAAGFREHGQKGSHLKFAKETTDGARIAIVPRQGEVAARTQQSILRQAGVTFDTWVGL